jgi:hypothetical protein
MFHTFKLLMAIQQSHKPLSELLKLNYSARDFLIAATQMSVSCLATSTLLAREKNEAHNEVAMVGMSNFFTFTQC